MKKTHMTILVTGLAIVTGVGIASFAIAQSATVAQPPIQSPVQPTVQQPSVQPPAQPIAQAPAQPVPVQPAAPVAAQVNAPAVAPVTTPPANQPIAQVSNDPQPTPSQQDVDVPLATGEMSLVEQFKDVVSFPLDEEKMIAYVRATRRVQRINDKWDVQIAAAESDQTAIEYNNFSIEEITASLKNISGLTLDEYNEMTRLTSTNKDFARVFYAYRDMFAQGLIGQKDADAKVEAKPEQRPAAPVGGQATAAFPAPEEIRKETPAAP